MKKVYFGFVFIVACIFIMSTSNIPAQDACEGNFDYDQDVDGTDAALFKEDFGRSILENPCPLNGPAPVPKTGQTTSYVTGDDGDLETGVAWPNPRFTNNSNGTVTDMLTGLIWLKDANCIVTNYPEFDNDSPVGDGRVTWQHALDFVAGINDGTYPDCGGGATDWRLPNRNELESLVHKSYDQPAVPNTAGTGQWTEEDPFTSVQSYYYWSSTTKAQYSPGVAWVVLMGSGTVNGTQKTSPMCVWPVRGGYLNRSTY